MMSEHDPDLPLVQSLQEGDKSALNEIMKRYANPLFRFIYRYFPSEIIAQDITQDVFVRCYFNIHQFRLNSKKAKFSTWLYRIAINLCRDYARSRVYRKNQVTFSLNTNLKDLPTFESTLVNPNPSPDQSLQTKETLIALEQAIHHLPDDLKTVLILTTLEGYSYTECAEILKTTPKTVEMRLYRARKILSQKFNSS